LFDVLTKRQWRSGLTKLNLKAMMPVNKVWVRPKTIVRSRRFLWRWG
jgi:hypothetical protein